MLGLSSMQRTRLFLFSVMRAVTQDLEVDITPRLATLEVVEPAKRKAGVIVASVAELVQKLHEEAKVI
jgi:hypothetical protein